MGESRKMNGKKRALKALCVLAAVIALCMFFARTVQTITTPKIQRITATKGKLEEKISLNAKVYFPETVAVFVKEAKKLGISIDEVMVRPGYKVEKGDVIFTASAPEYESKLEEIRKNYDKKVKELAEEKAGHIRFLSTTTQNDLYNQMMDAYDVYYAARYEAQRQAMLHDFELPADENAWSALDGAPEAVQQAASETIARHADLDEAIRLLKHLYNSGEGRVGDETFSHIKKMDALRAEIADYEEQMLALDALNEGLSKITAPHSGYITEVSVKQGDSYDGSKAAYTISVEGAEPALRADISQVTKTIAAGNKVTLENGTATKVDSVSVEADGKKYALIAMSGEVIKAGGGMSRMIGEESIPLTLTYKAAKNTTLLPASAVRQDGDGSAYVYVVSRDYGGGILGGTGYTVKKTTVNILEKTDKTVSLSDDLQYTEIADREDRALSDGQAVMDYVD